jgi:hypothetical protein
LLCHALPCALLLCACLQALTAEHGSVLASRSDLTQQLQQQGDLVQQLRQQLQQQQEAGAAAYEGQPEAAAAAYEEQQAERLAQMQAQIMVGDDDTQLEHIVLQAIATSCCFAHMVLHLK